MDFSGMSFSPFFQAMKSSSEITVMPSWRMVSICLRNFEVRMRIAVSGSVSEKSW